MELQKLNKKIRNIWLILGLICALIVGALFVVACYGAYTKGFLLPMVSTLGFGYLIILYFLVIYPFQRYNRYSWGCDEKRIYINYGVIFRHQIIIPVCQIQDMHLIQGPLMRLNNLGGIIISTAGSDHAIKGLDYELTKQIIEKLETNLQKRVEDLRNE